MRFEGYCLVDARVCISVARSSCGDFGFFWWVLHGLIGLRVMLK